MFLSEVCWCWWCWGHINEVIQSYNTLKSLTDIRFRAKKEWKVLWTCLDSLHLGQRCWSHACVALWVLDVVLCPTKNVSRLMAIWNLNSSKVVPSNFSHVFRFMLFCWDCHRFYVAFQLVGWKLFDEALEILKICGWDYARKQRCRLIFPRW